MFKRLMLIGVLTISLVSISRTEADAGCIDLGNGWLFCADWLVGESEICRVKIDTRGQGLGAGVEVTCQVFGTGGGSSPITGTLFCAPSTGGNDLLAASTASGECRHSNTQGQGHSKGKGKGHEGDCQIFENFQLTDANAGGDGLPLTEQVPGFQCNKKGVCEGSASLDPECPFCCSTASQFASFSANTLEFVTFIANQFIAVVEICVPIPKYPYKKTCEKIVELCTLHSSGNRYNCVPTELPRVY
jgi:hypothetical protein